MLKSAVFLFISTVTVLLLVLSRHIDAQTVDLVHDRSQLYHDSCRLEGLLNNAQLGVGETESSWCLAPSWTDSRYIKLRNSLRTIEKSLNTDAYVPVKIHIVSASAGSAAGLTDGQLAQIMATVSHLYKDSGLNFFMDGAPEYIVDQDLHQWDETNRVAQLTAASSPSPRALNMYFVGTMPFPTAGFAYYPYDNITSTVSVIALNYSFGSIMNATIPHELGHNFSLAHTHRGTADGPNAPGAEHVIRTGFSANCEYAGDGFCDTPADPSGPHIGCSYNGGGQDAFGDAYTPDVTNLMAYYTGCEERFSPEQHEAIRAAYVLRSTQYNNIDLSSLGDTIMTPTTLSVLRMADGVRLEWANVDPDAIGYIIERAVSGDSNGFTALINGGVAGNQNSYIDQSAATGIAYEYRLRVLNGHPQISPFSNVACTDVGTNCIATTFGCMNSEAHNYNPLATQSLDNCETCYDGIQNGDEVAIDCGGLLCLPCSNLCSDGRYNGFEDGIDCGGPDCPPCTTECADLIVENVTLTPLPNNSNQRLSFTLTNNGDRAINLRDNTINIQSWYLETPTGPRRLGAGGRQLTPPVDVLGPEQSIVINGSLVPLNQICRFPYIGVFISTDGNVAECDVSNNWGYIYRDSCTPNCEDQTANGHETGVDCGGTDCSPCDDCPSESLQLKINFSQHPEDITWTLRGLEDGIIYYQDANYPPSFDDSTFVMNYCVPDQCYTFTIYDNCHLQPICGDVDQPVSFEIRNSRDSILITDTISLWENSSFVCPGEPRCDDGVQNGQETGVDCGTPTCGECGCATDMELNISLYRRTGTTLTYNYTVTNTGGGILDLNGPGNQWYMIMEARYHNGPYPSNFGIGGSNSQYRTVSAFNMPILLPGASFTGRLSINDYSAQYPYLLVKATPNYQIQECLTGNNIDRIPFIVETCSDGLRNQDEEAIDCGGTYCAPCGFNCPDLSITSLQVYPFVQGQNHIQYTVTNFGTVPVDLAATQPVVHMYLYDGPGATDSTSLSAFILGQTGPAVLQPEESYTYTQGTWNYNLDDGCTDRLLGAHVDAYGYIRECNENNNMRYAYGADCTPTCDDGITNGDEIDIDCGGDDCGHCPCISGNVTLRSQAQVDAYVRRNRDSPCTTINGSLCIGPCGNGYPESNISNLRGLQFLTRISGALTISDNMRLTSLTGLHNITEVGTSIYIRGNNINSMVGLSSLASVDRITFWENNLRDLTGLGSLSRIDEIYVYSGLKSFVGLSRDIHRLDRLYISSSSLERLDGLEEIRFISDDFWIASAPKLIDFRGLKRLTRVGDRLNLGNLARITSLKGLERVDMVRMLVIQDNPILADVSALDNVRASSLRGGLFIDGNPQLSVCNTEFICAYVNGSRPRVNVYDNAPGCNSASDIQVACASDPTCNDGIWNGVETGTDCGGGFTCLPCPSCDAEQIKIQINLDEFPHETAWSISVSQATTVVSPDYHPSWVNRYVEDSICVEAGCYTFTITDAQEDGLCCDHGAGNFTLTDGTGNLLLANQSFSDTFMTEVCIGVGRPNCSDGIQNGNETGIDCGGPNCESCPLVTNINASVTLQGAYNATTNQMSDALRRQNCIATTEPFTEAGYLHASNGGGEEISNPTEVLADHAANSVVDWVLLELRDPNDISEVVATRSALLLRNGRVVSTDGVGQPDFGEVPPGSYYLAIRHRNHIGVASSALLDFSGVATEVSVDFTDGSELGYGTNALAVLPDGSYGLVAGDVNGDGQVNAVDANGYWRPANGSNTNANNMPADMNLDGAINAIDLNSIYRLNNSRSATFPYD